MYHQSDNLANLAKLEQNGTDISPALHRLSEETGFDAASIQEAFEGYRDWLGMKPEPSKPEPLVDDEEL